MDNISTTFGGVFADGSAMMLAVLVFLATAILTFGVMAAVRVRGAVKRRAAGIAVLSGHAAPEEPASLRQSSLKAAQRILDYTTKHYGNSDRGNAKVLRQRMIRAGRTMTDALEHFGDRLGLEEARSFATLIQQSAELGSSITEALRVYSDDMRHKRLSRAEEKAYSLPAKLAIPMMVCIFPVLFVVILCPVIVRMVTGTW